MRGSKVVRDLTARNEHTYYMITHRICKNELINPTQSHKTYPVIIQWQCKRKAISENGCTMSCYPSRETNGIKKAQFFLVTKKNIQQKNDHNEL